MLFRNVQYDWFIILNGMVRSKARGGNIPKDSAVPSFNEVSTQNSTLNDCITSINMRDRCIRGRTSTLTGLGWVEVKSTLQR